MTEQLTLDRFRELAEAYGGVISRWPERYREDAMAMASSPEGAAALYDATSLDTVLDAWGVPAPAAELREHVMRTRPTERGKLALRVRLWWSGIGIAAALAGAATGTAAVAMVAPVDVAPESGTSFGDIGGPET